jgi:threonine/homoserine/homoserine lactone efflux protein
MNLVTLFSSAALAHVLAVMSPGPDFAVVTRQTLAHGRSAGLRTAWGIASGIVLHVSYALFGLGWLLQHAPWLLEVLRFAGAAFLIWMGSNALRSQPLTANTAAIVAPPAQHDFLIGFTTNLLNPKATLFFVALCSALITTPTPLSLRLALGSWIVLSTGLWFSIVALTLGHPGVRQRLARYAHHIDHLMGGILILLGLGMLLSKLL